MFSSVLWVMTLQPECMEEFFYSSQRCLNVSGMSEDLSATEMAISSNSGIILNDMTKGFVDTTASGVRPTSALWHAVTVVSSVPGDSLLKSSSSFTLGAVIAITSTRDNLAKGKKTVKGWEEKKKASYRR